jgi:hypothetical protein
MMHVQQFCFLTTFSAEILICNLVASYNSILWCSRGWRPCNVQIAGCEGVALYVLWWRRWCCKRQINSIMLGFHSGVAEDSRLMLNKLVRTDRLTDWLTNRPIYGTTDWLTNQPSNQPKNQSSSNHALHNLFLKIHLNIILPLRLGLPSCLFLSGFPHR